MTYEVTCYLVLALGGLLLEALCQLGGAARGGLPAGRLQATTAGSGAAFWFQGRLPMLLASAMTSLGGLPPALSLAWSPRVGPRARAAASSALFGAVAGAVVVVLAVLFGAVGKFDLHLFVFVCAPATLVICARARAAWCALTHTAP